MPRRNKNNQATEFNVPNLGRGWKTAPEMVPDPTVPMVALDAPAVAAVETPGAVPRDKRTWPLTPPSKPPPTSGKQPPLRPMAPPPGKAHRAQAEGPRTDGRQEKQHSTPTDPTQCYWGWPNTPCSTASVASKRFCASHFREYREQRRGWSQ